MEEMNLQNTEVPQVTAQLGGAEEEEVVDLSLKEDNLSCNSQAQGGPLKS
jgi:hypothetical protein